MTEFFTPNGINYECGNCGHCCLGWPVPLTEEDYKRIISLAEEASIAVPNTQLADHQPPFTRMLGKGPDGRCQYLTDDNLCQIHLLAGPDAKPTICRQFPYSFTETPNGVYATVSFVSQAVLMNHGRPLSDQNELLQARRQLSKEWQGELSLDWSGLQYIDGFPMTWNEYIECESKMMPFIQNKDMRAEKALQTCSRILTDSLPAGAILERVPPLPVPTKTVDQLLLRRLYDLYMNDDPYHCTAGDLFIQAFLSDLDEPPSTVHITGSGKTTSFGQVFSLKLGRLDQNSEDLLRRFIYNRIFGKLYLGPMHFQFSLLAGLHHLLLLVCLVRLRIKLSCIAQGRSALSFNEIAEIVRDLERRLTQVSYSVESAKSLELLLTSPERLARMVQISA